jgi:uncharacterized protein (TIGR02246 family)
MTVAEHLAVEGVVKRWHDSLLAKDWNTFAGLYAEDAVLMPPNALLLAGNRAIAAWFANPGVTLLSFTYAPVAVEVDAVLAAVRSVYSMTFTVPGTAVPLTESGKGVLVLRRGEDGDWRIAIDIWNADSGRSVRSTGDTSRVPFSPTRGESLPAAAPRQEAGERVASCGPMSRETR